MFTTALDSKIVRVEYEPDRFGDVSIATTFVYCAVTGAEIEIESLTDDAIAKLEEEVRIDFDSEMVNAAVLHYAA